MKIDRRILKRMVRDALREYNIFHDENGEWSDSKDAKSRTYPNGEQYAHPSGRDRRECGRSDRKKKCKTEEVNPNKKRQSNTTQRDLKLKHIEQIIKDTIKAVMMDLRKEKTGCSWKDYLKLNNAVNASEKGELNAKPK